MEFREFRDPLETDYDIKSSYDHTPNMNVSGSSNPYAEELFDLIGFLEDMDDEQTMSMYGITMDEYFNPNAQTIIKVKEKLDSHSRSC